MLSEPHAPSVGKSFYAIQGTSSVRAVAVCPEFVVLYIAVVRIFDWKIKCWQDDTERMG